MVDETVFTYPEPRAGGNLRAGGAASRLPAKLLRQEDGEKWKRWGSTLGTWRNDLPPR
jgi:hypothetical protein